MPYNHSSIHSSYIALYLYAHTYSFDDTLHSIRGILCIVQRITQEEEDVSYREGSEVVNERLMGESVSFAFCGFF